MATDNATKIAALQAILDKGRTSETITVDGVTTTKNYDFGEIRTRIEELRAEDDQNAYPKRSPFTRIKFS